jgi:Uma2 family endonuclease
VALLLTHIPAAEDDDAIARFSQANPGWRVEYTAAGVLSLSPTFSDSGPRDAEAAGQLRDFAKKVGGKVFGSSTGFRIPGAGLKSPDAAWISAEHLGRLTRAEMQKFWTVCPDVVIEILSETDSWSELQAKLREYRQSGAIYAISIDPYRRDTYELGEKPAALQLDIDAIIDA